MISYLLPDNEIEGPYHDSKSPGHRVIDAEYHNDNIRRVFP